ncbi:MAG: hypothetical protein KAU50_08965 [Candidatus Marinimicrobia bacterium]|nr:hypothetical protein [Candidatus Neomarinimicrobiota bacterium]
MKTSIRIVSLAVIMVCISTPTMAQQGPPGLEMDDPGWGGPTAWQQDDAEAGPGLMQRSKQVEMVRMWKLTDYLELTEEQAANFFLKVRQHRDEMQEVKLKRLQLHQEFVSKLNADEVSSKDIDNYVDAISRMEKDRIDQRASHYKAVKDVLTANQLARYVTFEEHFKGRLREEIGRGKFSPRHMQREMMRHPRWKR